MGYENPHHLNLVFFQIFWTIQPVSSKKYPACQRCRKKTIIAISAAGRSWIWLFSTEFFLFSHSSPYPHKKKKTSPLPLKSLLNPNESSRNKKKKGKLHDSISAPIFCGDKENGGFFHKGILNCHGLQGKKKTFLNWIGYGSMSSPAKQKKHPAVFILFLNVFKICPSIVIILHVSVLLWFCTWAVFKNLGETIPVLQTWFQDFL